MKRIFIAIIILIAIILLANWWSGRIISSQINIQLTEILGDDQAAGLNYDHINVSPILSQITFNQFSYRHTNNVEFKAETIRTSLTYSDFLSLLFGNPSKAFNEISLLSMYINNSSWIDYNDSNEITLVDGFFILEGNIAEILQAATQKRLPSIPFNLEVDMYELEDQDLNVSQSFLPSFEQSDRYDYIESISGKFDYDPVLEEIHARDALVRAPFLDLEFDGTASFDSVEWSFLPRNLNINYTLNAQPIGVKFNIGPEIGQIAFDDMKVQSTTSFDTDDIQASLLNLLLSEGETLFHLSRIRIHPSDNILQEYGMFSQTFGLDLESIFLNRVAGSYALENNRLLLDDTKLETDFFTATLDADISLSEYWKQSVINEGSLRVSDMSSDIEEFFNDIEVLFDTEWQRDNGDILIYFGGSVSSPEIIK